MDKLLLNILNLKSKDLTCTTQKKTLTLKQNVNKKNIEWNL